MIGLDTNILARIVTNDSPSQKRRVEKLLEKHCTPQSPGFVTIVTIIELAWILSSHYNYQRNEIALVIKSLLGTKDLTIEHEEEVRRAWKLYADTSCDFPDALIGEISKAKGCSTTKTFDKKAAKLDTFSLV